MKVNNARFRRAAALIALTAAVTFVPANAASAHVNVSSTDAEQGGFGKLVFRVPNESPTATTQKVEVTLPSDSPMAFVSTKPVAGWNVDAAKTTLPNPVTVEGDTVTEAVTKVTWTAQGAGIAAGQFQEFEISGGPLPKASQVSFPATQTYSDGKVVQWNEVQQPGAAEPEKPAPTLKLAAATDEGTTESKDSKSDDSDGVARTLGIVAIVLAAAGVGLGLRRRAKA